MIVFGTKGGFREKGSGSFLCPVCKSDQRYVHVEVIRKGHLYFVPLIDLGSVGEFVQCARCDSQFDPAVLARPTAATMEQDLLMAVRGSLAMMIRADSVIDGRETEAARHIVKKVTGEDISAVRQQADVANFNVRDLRALLSVVADKLTEAGKVGILQACIAVAASDGGLAPEEREALGQIASALHVPEAYLPGIIESTLDQPSRRARSEVDRWARHRGEAVVDDNASGDGGGYLVVLEDAGESPGALAFSLRGPLGLKLGPTMRVIDGAPIALFDNMDREDAEEAAESLRAFGARASVRPRASYVGARAT